MDDGSVTITLDEATAALIKAAAEPFGESTQDFVLRAVANALQEDWAEDLAIAEEYDRTGEGISAEDAFAELDEKIAARKAARA